jgi:hypothetical protein
MAKHSEKYWEAEKPETIHFGKCFMRCYDKAGKLQFGIKSRDKKTGEDVYLVKFVIDRKELFSSDEAPSYLRQLITDWEEMIENERDD